MASRFSLIISLKFRFVNSNISKRSCREEKKSCHKRPKTEKNINNFELVELQKEIFKDGVLVYGDTDILEKTRQKLESATKEISSAESKSRTIERKLLSMG